MNKYPAVGSEALQRLKVTFITTPISPSLFEKYDYTDSSQATRVLHKNYGNTIINCSQLDNATVEIVQRHHPEWCAQIWPLF